MLPIPCVQLLFSWTFVQCLTLANQLNQVINAETKNRYSLYHLHLAQLLWHWQLQRDRSTSKSNGIKWNQLHKSATQALLLTLISPSVIDTQDSRFIFQSQVVFLSCDILTIPDSGFASLICNQFEFQASETTLKVTGLCPLRRIIAGSTDILGSALTDIPDATVCNYLFQSIEITTSPCNSTYLLCFSRQFTLYTTNILTSPPYSLHYLSSTQLFTKHWCPGNS